jgi:ParB family transcriptional regulator, chromosome partitioning protein
VSKTAEVPVVTSKLATLPLAQLHESPMNPRKTFDDQAQKNLTESVKVHGVLTALVVREEGEGFYEILGGARRFRAAQDAGLVSVPCQIVVANDKAAFEIVVIDNLQRLDIHPLEEAEGFARLLDSANGDIEGVSDRVSKPTPYIRQRTALLKLITPMKKLFVSGAFQIGHAIQIARLQEPDQKELVSWFGRGDEIPSVAALKRHIEESVMLDLSKVPWSLKDEDLVKKAGSCETCPKRTGWETDLFSDVKGNRCTDSVCYKEKMQAHMTGIQKELEAKGQKVVGIYTDYVSKPQKGALASDQWIEIKKRQFCDHATKGVVVSGLEAGTVKDICANLEGCKIHGPQVMHGRTPQEKTKMHKEVQKAKRAIIVRTRLLKAIWEKTEALVPADLNLVARVFFERLWHDSKRRLAKALGMLEKKDDVAKVIEGHLKMMKDSEKGLSAFILACALSPALDPRYNDGEELKAWASSAGINVAAIEGIVDNEMAKKSKVKKGKK